MTVIGDLQQRMFDAATEQFRRMPSSNPWDYVWAVTPVVTAEVARLAAERAEDRAQLSAAAGAVIDAGYPGDVTPTTAIARLTAERDECEALAVDLAERLAERVRKVESLTATAERDALAERVCPYVVTSDEGTSYCSLNLTEGGS